jgi:cytochrome c oxidase subunit 2
MNEILIIVACVLLLIVIAQVGKIIELTGVLRGEEKQQEQSNRINANLLALTGFAILISSIASVWMYDQLFLPVSASAQGEKIDAVRNLTLFFTGIVYVITQALLFWFVWRYQYNKDRKAYYFPEDNKLELAWTVIPAIVLTVLVVRGLALWFDVFSPVPDNAVTIEATAQQFRWNIRYPGEDLEFGPRDLKFVNTTNELGIDWDDTKSHDDVMAQEIVLPVDVPCEVKIRSLDVLHNFYLPHFRMKMDAVPGIPTGFWFTPTITTEEMRKKTGNPDFEYELACAELCGSAHYNMRKKVTIVTQEEYDQWVGEQVSYYDQVIAPQQAANTPTENTETE